MITDRDLYGFRALLVEAALQDQHRALDGRDRLLPSAHFSDLRWTCFDALTQHPDYRHQIIIGSLERNLRPLMEAAKHSKAWRKCLIFVGFMAKKDWRLMHTDIPDHSDQVASLSGFQRTRYLTA